MKPFPVMPVEDVFSSPAGGTVVTAGSSRGGYHQERRTVDIIGIKESRRDQSPAWRWVTPRSDRGQAGDKRGLLLRGIKREDGGAR